MQPSSPRRDENLYRSIWRWHFFAGLIVLPVLAWMALTGALYLYKAELERALYPQLVEGHAGKDHLPLSELIDRAEQTLGAKVTQVAASARPSDSMRLGYSAPGGSERLAFVRADDSAILETSGPGGPLDLIKRLHSLSVAGAFGNILVEIAAGWAILLVLSGFYLWWPRAGTRMLSLAGRVGERRFWRNLHASAGAMGGAVLLFLALTGMPWTIFWGSQFHAFVAQHGIGRPPPPASAGGGHMHDAHLPWSLRGSPSPHAASSGDLGPDRAIAAAQARGLRAPWVLDLPSQQGKPYRIASAAEDTRQIRLIYVDPGSGRILQDIGFENFGPGAKLFEWGIYTHQGHQYGEINRLIMLAGCIAVLLLALSAPIMWWKRRTSSGLSPPPDGQASRSARGALVLMLMIGVLFPLTGLTMVAALLCGRAAALVRG